MSYPQIIDYNEAVQHPGQAFFDADLKGGTVKENNLGLPLVLSGGFALTYSVEAAAKKYAVRCFHREIPEIEKKYEAIAVALKSLQSPYFVDFDFQEQGIRIRQSAYPIVRMDWVEGDPLGIWLDKNFERPGALEDLRDQFAALAAYLQKEGIAHGDLQNGNVMLQDDRIRLIDYDGMFVPGLTQGQGTETGHKHFQHPDRSIVDYGPTMDRFSFIALDLSLQAVIEDRSLYRKFREGGETLIFKANDFADPQNSEIFSILFKMPTLKDLAKNFAQICDGDISAIPDLEDFRAGRNIPTEKAAGVPHVVRAAPRVTDYISAFPVVDALDFASATRHVGDRVELIGQILDVTPGMDRLGKDRGRPFVFMNFAPPGGNVLRISVFADELDRLDDDVATNDLVGRWVSAAGLINAPMTGDGRTHLSMAVEQIGQMQFLTEAEAKFRLASVGKAPPMRNRDVVKQVSEIVVPAPSPKLESPVARPGASTNRNIVNLYVPQQQRVPEPPLAPQAPAVAMPPLVRPQPATPPVLSARPPFRPTIQSPIPDAAPPPEPSTTGVPGWMWGGLAAAALLLGIGVADPSITRFIVADKGPVAAAPIPTTPVPAQVRPMPAALPATLPTQAPKPSFTQTPKLSAPAAPHAPVAQALR